MIGLKYRKTGVENTGKKNTEEPRFHTVDRRESGGKERTETEVMLWQVLIP